jgi:hypothetical protein
MSLHHLTQVTTGSSLAAPLSYRMLDWEWPILKQAQQPSPALLKKIGLIGTGTALSNDIGFFSLGYFLITTSLLAQHPAQRELDQNQVKALREKFEARGIFRTENPGVVIGLGKGWNDMKNTGPHTYMISQSSPHLSRLSLTDNGPIGHVIRGGHRTAAIRNLAVHSEPPRPQEGYWYYQVLLPGKIVFDCSC